MSGDHNMKPCARDDIIKMAREAGLLRTGDGWTEPHRWGAAEIERFAALVAAAEREKVAAWMTERGYATGHGDTIEDLLKELKWQIREQEREACAKVCEELLPGNGSRTAAAIRARGEQ